MKQFIIFMFTLVATIAAQAQDSVKAGDTTSARKDDMETLIPTDDFTSGGFGALVIKVGPVDGDAGIFVGGRGGWVINRTFVIGGGGYGFTDMNYAPTGTQRDTGIAFGYGGLELEYLIASHKMIHGTVITHIGAGGFTVVERTSNGDYYGNGRGLYSAACFVFEPSVNVEVNILSWLRLAVGVGYRFVTGIDAVIGGKTYDNGTMSGVFGVGQIKFGPY